MKISINGGAFVIVPGLGVHLQPYNSTLTPAAAGNTNPLAGQPAFTGTDGGEVAGTWGESQIDLTRLGVKAGDTIQLRFDFGQDGCTGIDGWYVDNVTVTMCTPRASSALARKDGD